MLVRIDSVIVRPERQRQDLGNIDELAESIRLRGLINPITVEYTAEPVPEVILIAGERRLRACTKLGYTHIECRSYAALSLRERELIELEENLKRKDLTWQERALAVARLYRFHDEDITKVTEELGYSLASNRQSTEIRDTIEVAMELEADNEQVKTAQNISSAIGIIRRQRERSREAAVDEIDSILKRPDDALASLLDDKPAASVAASIAPKDTKASILVADFNTWAPTYDGPRFNLLHCDFPYGVGMDKSDQGKAAEYGSYADDEDTYWRLCQTLAVNADRLLTPDAHILFWFSMKFYGETVDFFEKACGFRVNYFPLIWMKSDNRGILPDANRGPRQIYETALLVTRGDRKIVRAVSNSIAHPLGEKQHQSQKPAAVMRYYLGMLVDGTTRLLDPTCGSGTAVATASELGAASALGLELNPEYARVAEANVRAIDADDILAAAGA